ncbi:hypothetical protein K2173_011538 [Erythroxylum novogranatense]|uniref:Golgin candidate 2 n=1 Tax=Erythroxylum novogranatense TaxID=1862640 RepID=A0AAV8S6W1_9ROSI|nr:hypothetical protein K2173_011538 [Erythroxylum novogranatense]
MANWISSKLKVAETFFEQIDQQAAESLKKNEALRSEDQRFHVPQKTGASVSLKDQLKKKTTIYDTDGYNNNDTGYLGKLKIDPGISNVANGIFNNSNNNSSSRINNAEKEASSSPQPKGKPTMLSDSDWTELLSTPSNNPSAMSTRSNSSSSSNGASMIRGLKNGGRIVSSGSNLSMLDRNKKNNKLPDGRVKSKKKPDIISGAKLNGKPFDGDESRLSARSSGVELQSSGKVSYGKGLERKDVEAGSTMVKLKSNDGNGVNGESQDVIELDSLRATSQNDQSSEFLEKVSDGRKAVADVYHQLTSTVKGKRGTSVVPRSTVSDNPKQASFSASDEGSDSGSDSGSTSDSESEGERERREKILSERAAAKAVEAIKERENMVARLEGEKQSLEKILEERAKQQVQEASQLQMTTMETMEAVELEKQKHNNTRMEALSRLAKVEAVNADLARSLATAQKNLELEMNQVAELRQQLELKEVALEELGRRISKTHFSGTYLNQLAASKGAELEREALEAEYSCLMDKITKLEDQAKKLEVNIEMTRKEMEDPTEVEIELKRRLNQLTDHLIQKQAQVEALSSEKATLLFRIEAVSRLLEENKSMMSSKDIESGTRDLSESKLRPLFEEKIRTGKKQLGSLLLQLDAIFLAGAVFLRRNPAAKLWSLVYLVCLHFWVIYILTSRSQASSEFKSGAVVSLENINNTAGL